MRVLKTISLSLFAISLSIGSATQSSDKSSNKKDQEKACGIAFSGFMKILEKRKCVQCLKKCNDDDKCERKCMKMGEYQG